MFAECLVVVYAVSAVARAEYYHTFSGRQVSPATYNEYRKMRLVPYCAIEVKTCSEKERRRIDYSCNNLHYPSRGTTLTPYRRMLPPEFGADNFHRPSTSGQPLPNARAVRTAVMSDGRVASDTYTHLVPNGAVFITGDITSVHDTVNYVGVTTTCCAPGGQADPRCMPIRVPEDDVHLRYSRVRCLNLTRAITYQDLGCVPRTVQLERVNTAPPMLDLSIIYGNNEAGVLRGREMKGGRMKSDMADGKEWPPSGSIICLLNQAPIETRCHDAPNPNANALIGSNLFIIWLYRSHNAIARRLEAMNPCWDDERIFLEAREINIAWMNQIWYYELMPALMGYDYLLERKVIYNTMGHIDDYDYTLEPRVSIEYVVSTRWFHTMQEGRLNTYSRKGKFLNQMPAVDMTLRTGILPNNRTLEGLTQGSFRQSCAAADNLIDPDMGERVLSSLQFASDVMSSDIMKGRDAGLPPYNKYRKICQLPVARDFGELRYWMREEQVDALRQHYETVDDIDLLVGIMAEEPMKGAGLGPTLACVMSSQLLHWRRADRFWYENSVHPGAFTPEQLYEIRKMTMSRFICDYGDEVDYIQPNAFLVAGYGNEMVDCKKLPVSRLGPWKDESCFVKGTSKYDANQQDNPFNFNLNKLYTSVSDYFNLWGR